MSQFQLYRDARGEYRWRLITDGGTTIATGGEGYTSKGGAGIAIQAVKETASTAPIVDNTGELMSWIPKPGEVAWTVEAWPYDPGANGHHYSSGCMPAPDVSRELRALADRIDLDWSNTADGASP